jgi:peptidoglycan hydrolase CwlO-like protein
VSKDALESADVAGLMAELSKGQTAIQDLSKEYGKVVGELDKVQSVRMEQQKQENEIKNKMRIIKSNIEAERERLKSIKIMLRAEASGL